MQVWKRRNLSEELAEALRDRIVDGVLRDGARINEVLLARQLGVSRTPLREALMRLVTEGAVMVRPRLGFFVRPLTTEELEQIYPMRALLDPEALRLAGVPSEKSLAKLKAINDELRRATSPRQALSLDDKFHLELLAGCPNRVLVALIEQFIRRTRRYELALMRGRKSTDTSVHEHAEILARLRRRDLRGACAALRRNMESGKEPILEWLRERKEGNATNSDGDALRGGRHGSGRRPTARWPVGRAARLRS
ncbi:MAG TPA: GntR family transcriptional regulator [Thermoanaerobaculia bacterium]|nr:GntR family transcriptional regulator [Thermoanaerobaculia bacterium]